jgi:membrane glycosyltransferase
MRNRPALKSWRFFHTPKETDPTNSIVDIPRKKVRREKYKVKKNGSSLILGETLTA